MKILILSLLLVSSALASEGAGGHGGDPFEVYAQPFPDQRQLDNALEKIELRVNESGYSSNLKAKILSEVTNLKEKNKFLYLESLIILPMGEGADQMASPNDLRAFIGLGAMTGSRPGDTIYFSKRALTYPSNELARLILHEVIHHLVPENLSRDEVFVEELAEALMLGKYDRVLQTAFDNGLNLREGQLDAVQLYDFYISTVFKKNDCKDYAEPKVCLDMRKEFVAKILKRLKIPMVNGTANLSFYNPVLHDLIRAYAEVLASGYEKIVAEEYLIPQLQRVIREAGKGERWSNYPELYCRTKYGTWLGLELRFENGCKQSDRLKLADIL